MKYSSQDIINNHRVYNKFMQLGIDDGWERRDKRENFQVMCDSIKFANLSLEDATILDVGCGTGDLAQFLSNKGIREYTGIDIFEPAVEKAKKKFPNNQFILADFLSYPFTESFDFVFCSGALTTHLDSNNYQILKSWIPKMWDLSKKGVVFNFLIERDIEAEYLFLYDPKKVIEICKKYTPTANINTIITDTGSDDELQEMHVLLY